MSCDTYVEVPRVSLQEAARRLHAKQSTIEQTLEYMRQHGSSVTLDYGEDNDVWECSWISGGYRFTGVDSKIRLAILGSLNKCFEKCVEQDSRAKAEAQVDTGLTAE